MLIKDNTNSASNESLESLDTSKNMPKLIKQYSGLMHPNWKNLNPIYDKRKYKLATDLA